MGTTSMPGAVHYLKCGVGIEDLQITEAPVPVPSAGELLIKIQATSLNPVDLKILRGIFRPQIPAAFPYIPCSDVSGEVIALGPGVTGFSTGDRVVSYLDHKKGGGLGAFAAAEASLTAKIPYSIPFPEAAGLPIAGLSALNSIRDRAGVPLDGSFKGRTILITAASGGVGTFAVQIAKLSGARVVATCGSRNLEFVRGLGADEVLDYKTISGAKFESSDRCRYDVIIHCAASGSISGLRRVLTPGGILVDVTLTCKPISRLHEAMRRLIRARRFTVVPFYLTPNDKDLRFLVELVHRGELKSTIDSVFPISAVREAWERCMKGHATGKIILVRE